MLNTIIQVTRTECSGCLIWAKDDNVVADVIRRSATAKVKPSRHIIVELAPRNYDDMYSIGGCGTQAYVIFYLWSPAGRFHLFALCVPWLN